MYSSVAEERSNGLWSSFLMCGCRLKLILFFCVCLVFLNKKPKGVLLEHGANEVYCLRSLCGDLTALSETKLQMEKQ